jgi:hypothetical protein
MKDPYKLSKSQRKLRAEPSTNRKNKIIFRENQSTSSESSWKLRKKLGKHRKNS